MYADGSFDENDKRGRREGWKPWDFFFIVKEQVENKVLQIKHSTLLDEFTEVYHEWESIVESSLTSSAFC